MRLLPSLVLFLGLVVIFADHAEAVSPVDIIWTDSVTGQILRGPASASSQVEILFDISDYPGSPSSVAPFGVAADGSFVYWSDATTGQILRGSIDGEGSATVLFDAGDYPGSPSGIAPAGVSVDETYVYWADNGTGEIVRGLKNGSGSVASLYSAADYPALSGDIYPWDVVVAGGNIYWSDSDTSQILIGATDGTSSVQALFTSAPERVNLGLTVDDDHVYWGDTENVGLEGSILRGLITGAGLPEVLYEPADYPGGPMSIVPTGMAARNGQLYWIDSVNSQVLTASTDGSSAVLTLFDTNSYPGSPAAISPSFLAIVDVNSNADYDNDGDVDGRDFLIWQRAGSPNPLSSEDLELWQEQYGSTSAFADVKMVPELLDSSWALIAGICIIACRRRVHKANKTENSRIGQ